MSRNQSQLGTYPNHWELAVFDTVAELKHGYQFRTHDFTESGIKVFKITQIKGDGTIDISNCDFIDKPRLNDFKKFIIQEGDILMALSGATIGKIARFKSKETVLQNYRVGNFLTKNNGVLNKDYFYYFLTTEYTYQQILANQTQSAQENVGKEDIHKMYIFLPPLSEQQSIASVLSSLDDKIDLLHRQNKTLEQMAETLFRQWFVEEAKDDWEEKPLDEIAEYLNGLALQKFPAIPGKSTLPAIKIREMNQGITDATDIVSAEIPEKYIVNDGDILFSWSGSLDVIIWSGGMGALNQHLFKVSSNTYPKWLIYFATRQFLPEFRDIANDKATTMGHIQRIHLTQSNIKLPNKKIIEQYDTVMSSLFEKIVHNKLQVRSIEKLRNTLLPKLMNGTIRVINQ